MILVLDLGSSSTRAMLFDEAANLIEGLVARRAFQFNANNEDDPEAAVQRVMDVLQELQPAIRHSSLVSAQKPLRHFGVSCYATSLLALDENRVPLTPVYTYADARCAEDARALRSQHDELASLHRTGCRIRANYWPAKLTWLKRTQPELFRRARWFCSLPEYLCWRLFGVFGAGISIASWTGLLNREQGDWDEAWLQALQIKREQLPPMAPSPVHPGESRGGGHWPMLKDAILHPTVGDGAAANIGSGCTDTTKIAVTIGTTAAMRIVRPMTNNQQPITSSSLWNYRVDPAHELTGGATTEGGSVFAWAQRALNLAFQEQGVLESVLHQQEPDAHGLTVLPMFAGERSPGYAEDVRATLHGLSLDTTAIDIARALLEAVAYRLAMIHDSLRQLAAPDAVLVGSGGALVASPTWCQIIADVTNTPLLISDEAEATAKGAAKLAIGNWLSTSALPIANSQWMRFEPDRTHHQLYRAAMVRQQELYDKLV